MIRALVGGCLFICGVSIASGETTERQAIMEKAEASLTAGPFSVLDKTGLPPTGDKHDYFSHRPYSWPNPDSKDGLPYSERDGQVNPDALSNRFDRVAYFSMAEHSRSLAEGYKESGREEFAQRCAFLIRTWFLDPKTRMNPNFNCSQWIPGHKLGTSPGIIRGVIVLNLLDTLRLIEGSAAWTQTDAKAWSQWLADYAGWLATSELAQQEARAQNNHGTWYDVQVATFAHRGGNTALAKSTLEGVGQRIASQIKPDGKMPRETGRTKSWSYSVMNLDAFMRLALLGKELDVDLASYKTGTSGSIRDALDYLVPYATGTKPWPFKQITSFKPEELAPVLKLAAKVYENPSFAETAVSIETRAK